jgi:hypothetical protein
LAGVAGDHYNASAHRLQVADGGASLGSDLVLEREPADDPVALEEVEHGCAAVLPLVGRCLDVSRF